MEPELHQGDLVFLVRGEYAPGDIVAYRSASMNSVVLHRIVRMEGDRYVMKGDNNDWLDSERPDPSRLIGRRAFSVPGGGRALSAARSPLGLALTGLALLGVVGLRRIAQLSRARSGRAARTPFGSTSRNAAPERNRPWAGAVAVVGIALSSALLLAPMAGSSAQMIPFEHAGTFSYSAQVPRTPVYPDGRVRTGDPVYVNLVPLLDVGFAYRFRSDAVRDIRSTATLDAEISDGNGWSRTIELQAAVVSDGGDLSLRGHLDIDRIRRLVSTVETLTGVRPTSYSLAVIPTVRTNGTVGGQPVAEEFSPRLTLQLDLFMVRAPVTPAPADGGEPGLDPARPSQSGSVERSFVSTTIGLGPIDLASGPARGVGAVGGVASLIVLALLTLRGKHLDPERGCDDTTRILHRYRRWIIPVTPALGPARAGIEVGVPSMETLVRLADRYGRLISHEQNETWSSFVVEENGTTYRYIPAGVVRPSMGQHVAPDDGSEAGSLA
jgi:hypothetical protein